MARFKGNPILSPILRNKWESKYVFNPAMFELGDKIHFIYRAMGEDMVSRLGYASSYDGYVIHERLNYPILSPTNSLEKRGCEDPRITVINDKCIMTYTAYSDIPQIAITTIPVQDFLEKKWNWSQRLYPFLSTINKNAVIFPEKIGANYVMLHRIDPNIYITYSHDLKDWHSSKIILRPRKDMWDSLKIGAAGPPINVDNGWLQIYHGVDKDYTYRLGAMVLDKENPEKVLYRSKDPFLEPSEEYECNGFVPNVVFSCGVVYRNKKILVSYGCADTVVSVSTFSIDEIIESAR
jgi:predicted GH43/DUF377 family glycosyl hydrolase